MRISFLNISVISFEVVISKAVFIGFNDESLHECGFSYVHRTAVVVFHIKFIGIEAMAAAYPVNTVLFLIIHKLNGCFLIKKPIEFIQIMTGVLVVVINIIIRSTAGFQSIAGIIFLSVFSIVFKIF